MSWYITGGTGYGTGMGLNKSIVVEVLMRLVMVLAGQGMGMILTEMGWYCRDQANYWYSGYGTSRTEHGTSRTGYGTGGTGLGMVLVGLMAPAEDFPHEQHRLPLLSLNPGWQAGTANPQ